MLGKFDPLFIVRYSATHRKDYNKIYRLDAIDAYNHKLVKRINVKGVEVVGNT
jgi:type III restriction enzyme